MTTMKKKIKRVRSFFYPCKNPDLGRRRWHAERLFRDFESIKKPFTKRVIGPVLM